MSKITKEQYEFAQSRIEELLPLVDDNTPANDKNAVELSMMSDIVIAYEKEHFPIEKPTVAELIELSLEEKGMTQKQLASEIGVSPSRVNDYIAGRTGDDVRVSTPMTTASLVRKPRAEFPKALKPLRSLFPINAGSHISSREG